MHNNRNMIKRRPAPQVGMEKCFLLFAMVFLSISGFSQTSLQDCIENALKTHPALKSRGSLDQITQKELENNSLKKYPGWNIGGTGKYQSDVVEFDLDLPFEGLDFPDLPHFQYNLSLNANQLIYNGGQRRLERELLTLNHKERIARLEVISREIKENVQKIFLDILLKDKQIEIVEVLRESLGHNLERLRAGLKDGVVLEMDVKLLEAEMIDTHRKWITLLEARRAMIKQLSLLSSMDLDPDEVLILPRVAYLERTPDRSEYDVFIFRDQALEVQKKMAGLKTIPRLYAFGQAGYGRPGLNFMSDQWQDFYVLGLQFSWIPWDYRESKRKKEILELNSSIIANEKENFDLQLQAAIDMILSRITTLEQLILEDEKMVELRQSIRISMEKKLEEGVITSSDYINELNREKQARLDLEKNKLDLLANKLAYEVIISR